MPICGKRSRRPDCLVCNKCKQEVLESLERKNAIALLRERFDDIVDPFEFVLQQGRKILELKQADLREAQDEREIQRQKLWQQAEQEVATIISSNGKGGDMMQYYNSKAMRHQSTVIRFRELKLEDKTFKRAYGLGQSIKSLTVHLTGIQKKREDYLSTQQDEKTKDSVKETDADTKPAMVV